jgi:hypothetical protein
VLEKQKKVKKEKKFVSNWCQNKLGLNMVSQPLSWIWWVIGWMKIKPG